MSDRRGRSRAYDTSYAPVQSTSPRGARAYNRTPYIQPSTSPAPMPSSSTTHLVGKSRRPGYSHVRSQSSVDHPHTETTQAVATGAIGGAFGPYSYEHTPPPPREAQGHRRQGSVSRFTNTPSHSSHSHEAPGHLPNLPSLIDKDTPDEARTRTGFDGQKYNLVFSDEFNVEGRTFYPGDDPFWEAMDYHYWPTGDLEWYDPGQAITKNGALVLTLEEVRNHDLNFRSGMLQTWNKFCFTTGYIEVAVSLPGNARTPGYWPGAWTMGNLGRAGYGATTEGTWPYSYDSCDVGTFPQQITKDNTPEVSYNTRLSSLPGQRLSACTCPGSDHPGPSVSRGRGAPEIDIIEAQINTYLRHGEVSQSMQVAPFNAGYYWGNSTPATTLYNNDQTFINSYRGGPYQQCVSCVSSTNSSNYVTGGGGFGKYGFEYWSNPKRRSEGFVTWSVDDKAMWTATSASVGPDSAAEISGRLISEEPMYIILNLGLSPSFQGADFKNLQFPATMLIDYVRVYQRAGQENIGCDPRNYPTADYIDQHLVAYTNPNLTTWDAANFTFPRNSKYDGC
ncbi:hypothetical protein FRC11_008595 [Ceratobasidium sp. 423]|nr:hypothetical protein FRC11_008595 [Ceratobasidium sp. 423]